MKELQVDQIETPLGAVTIVCDDGRLCALSFEDCVERMQPALRRRYGPLRLTGAANPHGFSERLRAYFDGDLAAIDAIPVDTSGTPFQQKVWAALRAIPAGSTLSYGALAARLGRPSASRAVGAANGQNPIAIVVPCHRLVGADSSLVKYGGGLERKAWLLRHEGARP